MPGPPTPSLVRKSSRAKTLVSSSLVDDLPHDVVSRLGYQRGDSGDDFDPEKTSKRKDWSDNNSEDVDGVQKKVRRTPGRKPLYNTSEASRSENNSNTTWGSSSNTGRNNVCIEKAYKKSGSTLPFNAGSSTRANSGQPPIVSCYGSNSSTTMPSIKHEPKTNVDRMKCMLCEETLKVNINARFHYSMHYYDEDAFLSVLRPEDMKDGKAQDDTGKVVKYTCSYDGCTKRKMGYKEMCIHLATAHQKLKKFLMEDKRIGMREVLEKLFPPKPEPGGDSSIKLKAEKHSVPTPQVISELELENSEDVDDPTEPEQLPIKAVLPKKMGVFPKASVKSEVEFKAKIHKVDKVHSCLICNGPGKNNKEGKNLNLGSGIKDLKYHYGMCVYAEGGFMNYVDHGQGEGKQFHDLEEYGKKYQYRCPFVACPKHHGRTKPIGYKEYAIHVGVVHHQVEKWMLADDRPGMRQVYDAIVAARERDGIIVEELPDVLVDEMHTCLICGGEDKDGRQLSFEGNKLFQLRYHYAYCFYDEGSYRGKYPPGPDNTTADGEPRDILGKEVKYSCEERGCNNKRNMGYKSFVVHMSNDHGGLEEVVRNHSRADIRALAEKIKKKKHVRNNPII